jgi:hypothetical protein
MLRALKRFLANEDGYFVAHDWAILASIILLGSVLALMVASANEPEPLLLPQPARIAPVEPLPASPELPPVPVPETVVREKS